MMSMMCFPSRTCRQLAYAGSFLMCLVAGDASAGPIVNLVTGLSLSMQPSTSGGMTLPFTNAGDAAQGINSYTLAIMVIQTSGSGALTFDSWSQPAAPLVVADLNTEYTPSEPPALSTLNAPINVGGTDFFEYFSVQVAATNGFNYPLNPAETKNAGLMTVSTTGAGTWDVYIVNQEPQPGGLPVSLLQTADASEFGFGNLEVGNGEFLHVGTITAVPEPSTVIATGVAIALCLGARRLNRRD